MFRFLSSRVVLAILLLAAFVCSRVAAEERKKAPPSKEQVAQWVRELGHDDFDKREEASKRLWEAGRLAQAPLKEALKSDDVEVQRRAQELLDKFKWGIYPDTPAKIVEMIQRYQAGANADVKAAIILELLDLGAAGRITFARISAAEDKKVFDEVRVSASLAFFHRGVAWKKKKDYDRALQDFDEAIRLNPKDPDLFTIRGNTWSDKKDYDRDIKDQDEAIRLNPKYAMAFCNRGAAWYFKKDYYRAIKDFDEAIALDPTQTLAIQNKACVLAACPDKHYRDGKKALEFATKACELTEWKTPLYYGALAAAYAETGNYDKAVEWQTKALKDKEYEKEHGELGRECLSLYKDKKPFRDK